MCQAANADDIDAHLKLMPAAVVKTSGHLTQWKLTAPTNATSTPC